ncbi:MAG: hypothetical protein GY946_02690 [bacterium]|nr:hypothetical protein [bacterium]
MTAPRALPSTRLSISAALLLAAVALTAPLPVYALSLATFGIVHVLTELAYVDRRFSDRVATRVGQTWIVLLGAIVLVRILAITGGLDGEPRAWSELGLVTLLALSVLPIARRSARHAAMAAACVLVVGLLLVGSAFAPFETLVILAFLHNLTPIGFLAEALEGKERRHAMHLCLGLFVVVPALLLSGLPRLALLSLGLDNGHWHIGGVGMADDQLGAFVPRAWIAGTTAFDMFTAAVYLQCLHYAVVIGVLPRLARRSDEGVRVTVPWPTGRRFVWLLIAASGVSLLLFAQSFSEARALYGIFAAVHAWVEVPVLLTALALPSIAVRIAT